MAAAANDVASLYIANLAFLDFASLTSSSGVVVIHGDNSTSIAIALQAILAKAMPSISRQFDLSLLV
ncbi:hypothetical protein HN51_062850 [Arachis hypogaea]